MRTLLSQTAGVLLLFVTGAAAQGLWEARSPYPDSATEASAAAIDGKMYVVCGLTPRGSIASLYIYDARTDSWSEGAPAPLAGGGDHCNVAAAGGKLYLLGAIRIGSAFVDGNTYEYDPATDRWQTVGRMNLPRAASGVAVIGTKIYVAGGLLGGISTAAFEVFDTVARTWTVLPDMPTARDHLTAQAAGGKFYAIAGRAAQEFTANEEFDPATNAWRARRPIPTQRGGLASGTIGGRIQVFGGEGNSGTPEATYRENEEYDPATDTWRSLAPMITPRHGLYGATIDDRIFAPAGGPRAGAFFSSALEVFYLPPPQPPSIAARGARNAASFAEVLAPGALASLFGDRLSFGEQAVVRLPLPVRLNAVDVRVDDVPAPLIFVSPGQVNFLIPPDALPGAARITVTNAGSASAVYNAVLEDAAPGIFTLDESGEGQGAIRIGNSAMVADSRRPARGGEAVEIYCTGLGRDPAVTVTIGGVGAQVLFAGRAPGFEGLDQVNAIVPAEVPSGVVELTVRASNGRASNSVTMVVE
jgi:uncharacterized protein (TIGR03437 family)